MCPATDNPASCENHAAIYFLYAKNMNAAEICHELCAVYGQNVMSGETVRQWGRMFKDRQININAEKRSVRPSVVNDDLAQSVD
jgi:predicted transcriptional regulator